METENRKTARKNFFKKVIGVDIGLLAVAGLVSVSLHLNFAILLFFLGLLVGGIGAYLGGADSTDPDNPKYLRPQPTIFHPLSAQDREDETSFYDKHSIHGYAFENVLALAGLVAIILSIPFLIFLINGK